MDWMKKLAEMFRIPKKDIELAPMMMRDDIKEMVNMLEIVNKTDAKEEVERMGKAKEGLSIIKNKYDWIQDDFTALKKIKTSVDELHSSLLTIGDAAINNEVLLNIRDNLDCLLDRNWVDYYEITFNEDDLNMVINRIEEVEDQLVVNRNAIDDIKGRIAAINDILGAIEERVHFIEDAAAEISTWIKAGVIGIGGCFAALIGIFTVLLGG